MLSQGIDGVIIASSSVSELVALLKPSVPIAAVNEVQAFVETSIDRPQALNACPCVHKA